jgi:hypothetical protein
MNNVATWAKKRIQWKIGKMNRLCINDNIMKICGGM